MGWSLNWFKSQMQKDLEALQVENQKKQNELLQRQLDAKDHVADYIREQMINTPIQLIEPQKLYRKLKLTGDVLTIVLQDGSVLTKPNAKKEDWEKARACKTEEELLKIAFSQEGIKERLQYEKEVQKSQNILKGIEILKNSPEFEVVDNSVYFKGIKRSIPELLVNKFAELVGKYEYHSFTNVEDTNEFQALKKFWLKCCLNPNAQSAEDLYTFLTHHQFKIDRHGNFYAYRRVVSNTAQNKELVEFISNTYNKVKAVWKKSPKNYEVINDFDGYRFQVVGQFLSDHEENMGNLEKLYLDLPNLQEKSYTDKHTYTFDYRIGSVISMPRNNGDDNNSVSCSKGFHCASKEYDYSSFGDTPILVIVNPTDVLAVPLNEVGKLRTCRWFFASTLSEDEEHILDDEDFDVSDLGDVFEEKCMENLAEYVQNSFAEEVKRHTFTLPSITGVDIQKIVTSLEEMKESLSKRVSVID